VAPGAQEPFGVRTPLSYEPSTAHEALDGVERADQHEQTSKASTEALLPRRELPYHIKPRLRPDKEADEVQSGRGQPGSVFGVVEVNRKTRPIARRPRRVCRGLVGPAVTSRSYREKRRSRCGKAGKS
jgi:hypothetical protein